jgi:predicted ABC-type transport system involved in lysophospholipase L1 biosynthesis ATPase subunit
MPLLAFEGVTKRAWDVGGRPISLLDAVSFEVAAGDSVGVLGMRRSGKSTLLRIAAGVEPPDGGTVRFEGRDLTRMSRRAVAQLLKTKIGFASAEWHATRNEVVVNHVALPALSLGRSLHEASRSPARSCAIPSCCWSTSRRRRPAPATATRSAPCCARSPRTRRSR